MLKILQINSVCGVGSTGRIVMNINNFLREKGIESYIAYGRESAVNNDNIFQIGSKPDYYIHGGLTRIFDTHGLWGSEIATWQLIKRIKFINPDVIHLHNIHGYYINIKVLFEFLKHFKKPIVWTLHDCWSFTGHCAYFDYAGCNKWKTGCHNCPEKNSYPGSFLFDHSKKNYEKKKELFSSINNITVVTPSKWLANLVQESFLNKYTVKVIYNGIDLNVFKPTESNFRERYGLQEKFIILGTANVWDRRKGLPYFKELADKLDENYKIVLVGLTKRQKDKLPDKILGITRTNNIEELTEIYSTADVFMNPTLEDVFGIVNLEALACGTPVITFNTGGCVECIDDSCGIVVEKGNIAGLMKAIKQINKHDYSVEYCLKRSKLFALNMMFNNYYEIYHDLV